MPYREHIEAIRTLKWAEFEPLSIVWVSFFNAQEFAESLRLALRVFPDSLPLKEMANGELKANNLKFGGYVQAGDHSEFLEHFLFLSGTNFPLRIQETSDQYIHILKKMSPQERAMTIFSREIELPRIFSAILSAHNWSEEGLNFFEYYLRRHIELDSKEGGHADLIKDFERDPNVPERFWRARLDLYQQGLRPMDSAE